MLNIVKIMITYFLLYIPGFQTIDIHVFQISFPHTIISLSSSSPLPSQPAYHEFTHNIKQEAYITKILGPSFMFELYP